MTFFLYSIEKKNVAYRMGNQLSYDVRIFDDYHA
jgi:hypothetical protein